MDAAERALLADTVRDAVAGASAKDQAPTLDAVLEDLGWLDMLGSERDDAIAIVFSTLGATNANATALDDVILFGLGEPPRADLAVLLPPFGSWDPPDGSGLATARVATADELFVVHDDGSELRASTMPASDIAVRLMHGIDPDARFHVVDLGAAARPTRPLDREAWDTAVALAQRALAHQVAGATRTMLELAREHALGRVQFGRPVARFQAVRHRLAEALVAIESLDAALGAAADEPGPETAALAKAVAGRTARTVADHCQQVLAGIGFTTDHPFHQFLKRTMLLDGIFGSADDIVVDVGRRLLATRTVPTLIEL